MHWRICVLDILTSNSPEMCEIVRIHPRALCVQTHFNILSSLDVRDQILYPYKTRGKMAARLYFDVNISGQHARTPKILILIHF